MVSEKILVVDDQLSILEPMSNFLEEFDYQTFRAQDGAQALAVLEDEEIDLVIADIAMPRMNGYQLLEQMRQNPDWNNIPFVFLSARSMDSDVRYGKELGVDDYLMKPASPEDLLAMVRGKLRRAQQMKNLVQQTNREAQSCTLEFLPLHSEVKWGDKICHLSAREYRMLSRLWEQRDHLVAAEELVLETHGKQTDPARTKVLLPPLVRSLRRKFGFNVGEDGFIESVRGVGYRLISSRL